MRCPGLLLFVLVFLLSAVAGGCFSNDARRRNGGGGYTGGEGEGDGQGEGEGEGEGAAPEADGGRASAEGEGEGEGQAPADCTSGDLTRGFALGDRVLAVGFDDQDGQRVSLHVHCGEVVHVEAGSETCGICMSMLPELIASYRSDHDQGLFLFYVLLVARSGNPPTQEDLQRFRSENALPFPVVGDPGNLIYNFAPSGEMGIPFDVLIDRQQVIRLEGASVDRGQLNSQLAELLGK